MGFERGQIYEKGSSMSTSRIRSMITDSNQASMAKMTGRRVQEGSANWNRREGVDSEAKRKRQN